MKQDLLSRKDNEDKRRSAEDFLKTGTLPANAAQFFSPPAPPLPAKFTRDSVNPAQSLNFDPAMFIASHHPRERPRSVLTMSSLTTPTGGQDDLSEEKDSGSGSETKESSSNSNSNSISHSNSESITSNSKETPQGEKVIVMPEVNGKKEGSTNVTVESTVVTIHTPV